MASQIKTEDDFKKRYEFTIHDQIGSGGFGTVFRAKDKARNDRIVAIKRAEIKLNAEFTLKKEFNLCNELNHRNIVRYEACYTFKNEHGGHEYIVMEFYEEGNLRIFLTNIKINLLKQKKNQL